jgi:putative ABC transport system ATP-binding protein
MNANSTKLIQLRGITKIYGEGIAEVAALRGISLDIDQGEFVALMGPSGSGKSTCMNIIGCMDQPTSGQYLFQGKDITALPRDQRTLIRRNFLGYIFQSFNLLNRTSALENVGLPLVYRGISTKLRNQAAFKSLGVVGMQGRELHKSNELSGGQQQRVAIARALVTQPALILADEPTGNLDSKRSEEIMGLLTGFNKDFGITVIMVTHEPEMASYANRIVQFHDGLILQDTRQ